MLGSSSTLHIWAWPQLKGGKAEASPASPTPMALHFTQGLCVQVAEFRISNRFLCNCLVTTQ